TEVENFPGWPAGDLSGYMKSSLDEEHQWLADMHQKEGVSGPELMHLMRQQAKNFDTRIVTDDIVEIDLKNGSPFRMKSAGGQEVETHAVIIATGASANYLGLDSEERFKNKGVSACAVCDGALPRFRNQPVVVVGGGDSAVEEADYLTKHAGTVYLVHRRDELRASKIMADRAKNNPKIDILWNTQVSEVLGDDETGMTGVRLASTVGEAERDVEATGMFVAIGHTPNTKFLGGQLDMNDKGYITWTVPFRTNTSVEGVFAAGDVSDDYYRQACTASGTGCMAALDAERWLASKGI
ncbi:MAG: FAD-dependent oxidoreductase, partial [Planctomycetota bacterium]